MNRIYRLIWNTTLACWVVASEHTRSRGKATRAGRTVLAAAALATAAPVLADDDVFTEQEQEALSSAVDALNLRLYNEALLRGAATDSVQRAANRGMSATVNDTYFANSTLNGENSLALGSRAYVVGNRSTAIGNEAVADGGGHTVLGSKAAARGGRDAVAIGINALANGTATVVIGEAAQATYDHAIAVGRQAKAYGTDAVVLGNEAHALGYGNAIGHQANANNSWANAIGFQAKAQGAGSSAMGYRAHAGSIATVALGWETKANAPYSLAFGYAAEVNGTAADSIAMGRDSNVGANAASAVALGLGATVNPGASNALALGSGSVAAAAGTVSVGSATLKRKIVNLADGEVSASSSDAVTGKQLHAVNTRFDGQSIALGENARIQGGKAIAIGYNALVETVGGVDGIAIGTNARGGSPGWSGGVAIGGAAESNYDGVAIGHHAKASAVRSVALGRDSIATINNTVSVGNDTLKRKIVNVADGALAAASTEAVTGRQLFTTNQNVTTAMNTADTAKATADAAKVDAVEALGKANHLGGLIGETAPDGSVRLGGENAGVAMDIRNSNGGSRTLSGVAAGALHATSSDAVNGAQLNAVNERVELHAVAIGVNRLEIGVNRDDLAELREAFDNFEPDLSGVVRYNADRTLVDLDGAGVTGLAAGEIGATSRDAVNGAQLFGTNERVEYLEEQQRYVMVDTTETTLPAKAGYLGVAVGGDAEAREEGATAVGSYAAALGRNSVALGRGSYVAPEARDGFALGTRTNVEAVGGMAIGAGSDVMSEAYQSVALGAASVATEADTVSVGSGDYRRRLVSMARGTKDDNATALVQLREAVTALGGGAAIDAAGDVIAPKYTLSGGSFNNVGDALTSIDTKLVSHKDELGTLDTRFKALVQNDRSIRYNDDRSVVDFGGARVTGVAAGSLKADSSDGVNGAQLFATNERIAGVEQHQRYVSIGADQLSGPAVAGSLAVAVGGDARASVDGATAVGSFANAHAVNSVALGRGALVRAGADAGFALGTNTEVLASGGLAIGALSSIGANARRAVALGNESVATQADTVSIGNDNLKRRIVNVAHGIKSNDATTVSQLRGALAALGGGTDLDPNGNVIGPRFAVQGSEYGSFGDAITALDGGVGDNKRNLESLDSRFQRLFQESPSANAEGSGRLSFGGAQGMVLGNVANGLIGQGSRDAVNGGQLWAVKQDLQGQIDALDPGKGEGSGSSLAMNGRSGSITPSADSGSTLASPDATPPAADPGNVAAQDQLVKAEGDNAVAVGSEGKERQVKHVAEGRADTDAANVRQVNDALERANAYTDSAVASVNQRLDQVDKRINRMAAISSAQSAMAMNTAGLATANRLGAGVGYSEGESAMAVGYQRVLTERGSATFSLNGAFTNSGEKSVGVGVGIGW